MNMVQRGREFVQSLLQGGDPRQCPYCGYRMTKKHGHYTRTVRLLGGAQQVDVPRHWCHRCRKTYSVTDRRWVRSARYGREVQRKALDLYFYVGASWRQATEWLRGEVVPGLGRSQHWQPWQPVAAPNQAGAHLSHVSLWRWGQQAGVRAQQHEQRGAWQGVGQFSGAVVADATGVCIRGLGYSVHLLVDAVHRVSMQLTRLEQESEAYLAGRFRLWLQQWGLRPQQVRVLISDGANVYYAVLGQVLRQADHQRCRFHLWRNLLPVLRAYQDRAGEQAGRFVRFLLKALFALPTLEEAYSALEDIERTLADVPELADLLRTVRRTLPDLWATTEVGLAVSEQTSNLAERSFRKLKQRIRRMGNFMSLSGADHFLAAWLVFANCDPYQFRRERKRRYRYPGHSPLAIAQADLTSLTWLDLLQV